MKKKEIAVVEPDELIPDAFKSLDEKQREFCREYVNDWNGTRAHMAVYGSKNGSARTAACALLARKRIKMYCDYLNDNTELVTGVSKTWVVQQHLKLVRSSIAHLHDTWIDRKEFDELTEDQKYCIEEITTQTRTEQAEDADGEEVNVQVDYVKIKLYNKQKSLDAITRLMGYEKAQRVDITSLGEKISMNTLIVNVSADEARKILTALEKDI